MTRKQNPKGKPSKDEQSSQTLLDGWKDFLAAPASIQDRVALGRKLREECPRREHGAWKPRKDRKSPLKLLATQDQARVQHLIPIRYGRMMQSPFAFYRGASLIMASDLASSAKTNLNVQLCGDCHLSNFGIFATPERNVLFDLNDFDETLPGPFEWDLKRLAASFAVAAANYGFSKTTSSRCVHALVRFYKRKMAEYAQMTTLDVWYERVDWDYLVNRIKMPGRKQSAVDALAKLKEKRSHAGALAKLTEVVDGKRRIRDNPPTVYHADTATADAVKELFIAYSKTLWQSRQKLLQRYHFVDVAAKVVGVGSVGTVAGIVLLQGGGGEEDEIFLQIKEATSSVLERYLGKSEFDHPGQRVVNGQRLLQSSSDLFLGWTSGPKRDFYVRQLMDVKASVPVEELDAASLEQYAEVCAYVLARAHARSGDPVVISSYLGKSESFDDALTQFALAYTEQNERDFIELTDAIKKGKVQAAPVK